MEYQNPMNNGNPLRPYRQIRCYGPLSRAFTVLELLVVISILMMLFGLLLPAIQATRGAARRMQCGNHLRQIGLALQLYHESQRVLPAGWLRDSRHKSTYGWAASLLPYLEAGSLYSKVDFEAGILAPVNGQLRSLTPEVYLCPADIASPEFTLFEEGHTQPREPLLLNRGLVQLPSANYAGVFGTSDPDDIEGDAGEGAMIMDSGFRWVELRRGLSHVFLVGERTARKLPSTWLGYVLEGEDAAGRVVGNAFLGANRDDADECEFDSRHVGGVDFLWADGHVDFVANEVDTNTYRRMATRGDGPVHSVLPNCHVALGGAGR